MAIGQGVDADKAAVAQATAARVAAPTIFWVVGVPANSLGSDGSVAIRVDGGAGTCIYQKRSGAWVATAA